MEVEDRFWAKVNRDGPLMPHMDTVCWVWTASDNGHGYGYFWIKPRKHQAHRVAYEWEVGLVPAGYQLDHRCLNRPCVRPLHLRPATNKQNAENPAGLRSTNTSGVRGVSWDKLHQRWRAQVQHNGKVLYLGLFDEAEDAAAVVVAKRLELFTFNEGDRLCSSV